MSQSIENEATLHGDEEEEIAQKFLIDCYLKHPKTNSKNLHQIIIKMFIEDTFLNIKINEYLQ